ncbi:hypothetical protein LPQ20_20815 [Klebsiella pneumoniae]|uniref:hypothetical protein n=1 Tax=Enterobacter hormaechei TaxID=158836 RepID=UPI003B14DCF2|nr:hypothetical protein [Klebsiella pneumoniae]
MEFTKERLLKIQSWSETYGPGSNVVLPAEEAEGLARIALAAQAAGPVYQWRERFEDSDLWDDCTKEQYEGFAKRPDVETRILYTAPPAHKANPCLKAMMQALDAFYAEEVPERGMLLAFRILLDDYQARTQQEARND